MWLRRSLRKMFPAFAELAATWGHRTYAEDGLITRHCADFLQSAKFISAYAKGKATRSWGNMEPRWRVYVACWAAQQAAALPGDFVECGVNRGGMALAVMEYLDFNQLAKKFFLLDTYCGFPPGSDFAAANANQYGECYAEVTQTFAPYPGAVIIRGRVPATLAQIASSQICYLSVDMNSAQPEVEAVRQLWPRLVPGGIVLLDDYAGGPAHRHQKQALDKLAGQMRLNILALPTGQGLIFRQPNS